MNLIKKIFSNIHRYILWALLSALIWAFVFSIITDADRKKKVTVFFNTPSVEEYRFEEALDEDLPEGIRMVKVHGHEYTAFDSSVLNEIDIFILAEKDITENLERFSPITGFDGYKLLEADGVVYGVCVYDPASGIACADEFVDYASPGGTEQIYYLCFLKDSPHIGEMSGSGDSAAVFVAKRILGMN